VFPNMASKRLQIGPGRFLRHEAQRRQTARRVVNDNGQCAARCAALEPVMRMAVDLDQFAKPRTPLAELKHTPDPAGLRPPQPHRHLHLADALTRDLDPLRLQPLLRRQSGAKIRVFVAHQHPDPGIQRPRWPIVRRPATLVRHQSGAAFTPPTPKHPPERAHPDAKPFRRLMFPRAMLEDLAYSMRSIPL
jgi:hypothetical protein